MFIIETILYTHIIGKIQLIRIIDGSRTDAIGSCLTSYTFFFSFRIEYSIVELYLFTYSVISTAYR